MHVEIWFNSLTLHVCPSLLRMYPERQEQLKEPGVLEHSCSQLWVPSKHSLISAQRNTYIGTSASRRPICHSILSSAALQALSFVEAGDQTSFQNNLAYKGYSCEWEKPAFILALIYHSIDARSSYTQFSMQLHLYDLTVIVQSDNHLSLSLRSAGLGDGIYIHWT